MSQHYLDTVVQASRTAHQPARMREQSLPFTVRVVRHEDELMKAVQIRQAAYGRHLPEFAQTLRLPEALDMKPGVAVLLAESKLDGAPLGTMRIQTNRFQPLALEQSLALPPALAARPLAEATRLGVTGHQVGRMVKTLLFKAYYQYCVRNGIEWLVIAGRSPIDRQYDRLLFSDVYPGLGAVPLCHAGNIPHRVMSFEVGSAERRWREASHPLYELVFQTRHADLDLGPDCTPFVSGRHRHRDMRQDKMAA
ncbi:MAG: hypothetical protein EOP02_16535 [Proteobacteria bacterium]|jgi:hypothetical protein|nr:MAG: hypothetical protein EOP02_16535 [Pseudomonadota bacterium]